MKIPNCYKFSVKFDEYKLWIIIDLRSYEYNLTKVTWMDKNYIVRIKIKDDHILLLTIYAIDAQDKLTVNVHKLRLDWVHRCLFIFKKRYLVRKIWIENFFAIYRMWTVWHSNLIIHFNVMVKNVLDTAWLTAYLHLAILET